MNVLIVTYLAQTSPSGVVTYTQTLAADLTGAGVGVQVVDSSHNPPLWRKGLGVLKRLMRPLGGAFHVVYDEFAYFTGIYLAVRNLRQSGIDVIHAQDVRSGVAAWLALDRQVPVVLTCHFNNDPVHELVDLFSLKSGFTRRLTAWYKRLFSHVHHYIFVSDYAYAQSKHLLPADIDTRILRNTVSLDASAYRRAVDETDAPKLVISNVGYIDDRKNQQLLLRIGHELRHRGYNAFTISLIGDGPRRADYEKLAAELDLTGHVTFYGRQEAPWKLVAQSDLYVHTALNDNCPYAIVEAFAVGTPVLALPVGGIPEMLPDGSGLLRGTDVNELTTEISGYFDPARRQRLAHEQAAYAATAFNHEANLVNLIAYYHHILNVPAPALPVLVANEE